MAGKKTKPSPAPAPPPPPKPAAKRAPAKPRATPAAKKTPIKNPFSESQSQSQATRGGRKLPFASATPRAAPRAAAKKAVVVSTHPWMMSYAARSLIDANRVMTISRTMRMCSSPQRPNRAPGVPGRRESNVILNIYSLAILHT